MSASVWNMAGIMWSLASILCGIASALGRHDAGPLGKRLGAIDATLCGLIGAFCLAVAEYVKRNPL